MVHDPVQPFAWMCSNLNGMKSSLAKGDALPKPRTGRLNLRLRFQHWHASYGPQRFFALCVQMVKLRRLQRYIFSLWWSVVKYPRYEVYFRDNSIPKIWGVQNILHDKYETRMKTRIDSPFFLHHSSTKGRPTKLNKEPAREGGPKCSERRIMFDSALETPDWNLRWTQRCSPYINGSGATIHKGLLLRACSARNKLKSALPAFAPPGEQPRRRTYSRSD